MFYPDSYNETNYIILIDIRIKYNDDLITLITCSHRHDDNNR